MIIKVIKEELGGSGNKYRKTKITSFAGELGTRKE